MVKWPEKAVSESSNGPVQLSFLVQVERAACVTFPLCAVKVTHWTGAVFLKSQAGAVLRPRGSKALRQCRPQPVKVKRTDRQQVQTNRNDFGVVEALTSELAQLREELPVKFSLCRSVMRPGIFAEVLPVRRPS